ncbi:MAG: dTMP kinase [Clostridiales bacterium]|jgi:dTMP kinase|nr:dTMP kinase [Clostridiales bacterium]
MNGKPRFIVFEGLDGSGKSTQVSLLSERLTQMNAPHTVTREPTSANPVGRLAREAINGAFPLENETLALLFAADRYQHVAEEVLPALNRGEHVLCDRYYFSNFAYQGGSADFDALYAYNRQVMKKRRPDLVLFIDVPPEECVRRIMRRDGKPRSGIYENLETLRGVRRRYLETFEKLRQSENIVVLEAGGLTERETAELVYDRVRQYI